MIDSQRLLQETKKLLTSLEKDIRERLNESPELDAQLQAEWNAARSAKRTAGAYLDWRDENITQSAVHWILACVFLRFLEDNNFLSRVYLTSADSDVRTAGRDYYERYFSANPNHSDLEYLLHAFNEVAQLPALKGLYDERHNPLFRLPLSYDGGITLLGFWRRVNPESGALVHDFTHPTRGTRFLGDLYQDLSASARDRYALLQTPEFVEEFILDRTLTPAIGTFGKEVRLIDPTCGSGHFLLGTFRRLFDLWEKKEPARNLPDLAQQALNGVYGVDLNPFAVEIARFRLLIAALAASDIRKLKDAPDFRIHLAAGDSLLHGPRFGLRGTAGMFENEEDYAETGLAHAYQTEDLPELQRILGQQYHAVVGNPPYITPKDAALRAEYRNRYISCHMKYSLGAPFTERFFELAVPSGENASAGFVGMITANSFMKREFGKKLIEAFLPTVDLTHVIDTSGAYIPGHGTPTVILFGRYRRPLGESVRTVMGIKGEPSTPADPARGQVWSAILSQVDQVGSESEFISVAETPRTTFAKHPWSVGGGGAADLREILESHAATTLKAFGADLGFMCITGEDEAFVYPRRIAEQLRMTWREFVVGDVVRDWVADSENCVTFPYQLIGDAFFPAHVGSSSLYAHLMWVFRTVLRNRSMFGKSIEEHGYRWDQFIQFITPRITASYLIAFGEVATHNHFVLDRGGKVFKQTAPVIKLKEGASEEEHMGLLGLLNSSVACFWLKQVCHNKGSTVDEKGARQRTMPFEDFYAFNSTKVAQFPLTGDLPVSLASKLDNLAQHLVRTRASDVTSRGVISRPSLDEAKSAFTALLRQMVALQEELDWTGYRLYGITSDAVEYSDPPEIGLGERAFEVVLARRIAAGEEQTTWFERHGSKPITELPMHWPNAYRAIVERRIALIESERNIGLIERPEYKRRWNTESWENQEQRALREWLLDRLEAERYWPRSGAHQLRSVFQLSDAVRSDAEFMQVAALYAGRDDFDVSKLVADLTDAESVPFLAAWRYTDDGLRKHEAWEETWKLQRQEDAIDEKIAASTPRHKEESEDDYRSRLTSAQRTARQQEGIDIPVPPKYKSSDFRSGTYWRLRGALDVPKERFICYPAATPDADGTMLLGWAGWDHLQQATALAGHYLHLKENEGWQPDRLIPLLAGLNVLVPWLKQWHNEWNAEHDARMGDYFEGFVQDEARALEASVDTLKQWRPPVAARRRRKS